MSRSDAPGSRGDIASGRKAATVEEAADAVVALHSSDPVTVRPLGAGARPRGSPPSELEDALYERRSLVRMLGMRRTLFVVPRETGGGDGRGVHEGARAGRAPAARRDARGPGRRPSRARRAVAEPGRWTRRSRALEVGGRQRARELTRDVPELGGASSPFGEGKTWARRDRRLDARAVPPGDEAGSCGPGRSARGLGSVPVGASRRVARRAAAGVERDEACGGCCARTSGRSGPRPRRTSGGGPAGRLSSRTAHARGDRRRRGRARRRDRLRARGRRAAA